MPKLIHYSSSIVTQPANFDLPGIETFSHYFKIYGQGVVPNDRTGTITFPVRLKSLFPMPQMRPFTSTLEEICDERAKELLARAERLGIPMYVFWSGGIDSTLVLVSLLKYATPEQKKNIVVLMSDESITENPNFYRDHVRGKLKIESATRFPLLLGGDFLIVNGEHSDQLFGSDIVAKFVLACGTEAMHKPYSRDTIFGFYNSFVQNAEMTNRILDQLERLRNASPVPISTNYLFFWWVNFALKWQTVSMRMLTFASKRSADHIDESYTMERYAPFYRTDEFQLWSMNNLDKKIKDEWRTYKWPAKDIIYEFTKDADYRDNKIKRGSLHFLVLQQKLWPFIDEEFNFLSELPREAYFEPANDFK